MICDKENREGNQDDGEYVTKLGTAEETDEEGEEKEHKHHGAYGC